MYLTTNPTQTLKAYYSDMQDIKTPDAIEAEAGSALRSDTAWGSGEWLGLCASATAWQVKLSQSLQPPKKAAKQSPRPFPPWRRSKTQQPWRDLVAVGWVAGRRDGFQSGEHASNQRHNAHLPPHPASAAFGMSAEDAQAIFATAARCMSAS